MRIDVSNDLGEKLLAIAKRQGLDKYAAEQLANTSESIRRNATMGKAVRWLVQKFEGVRQ